MSLKQALRKDLETALKRVRESGVNLPATVDIQLERTRDEAHGDFANNSPLVLAKTCRMSPRALAEKIVSALPPSTWVQEIKIDGPGFINFFLTPTAYANVVADILAAGENYGRAPAGSRGRVLVEFVSANPTGPLHVGHGRNAAYGDSLCNILAAAGYEVSREFYINDAGRQMDVLAVSVWVRYLELLGQSAIRFPRRGYPGAYVREMAEKYRELNGDILGLRADMQFRMPDDPEMPEHVTDAERESIKKRQELYLDALIKVCKQNLGDAAYVDLQRFARDTQLKDIRETLDDFGVHFGGDAWYSERTLVESGLAERRRAELIASGHTYEKDGALWFRTTGHGDDKDRVLVKSDGTPTYFGNDLAYHVDKLDRGYPLLIDVWGADHNGLLVRMRAAIESLTGRRDALEVLLIQFVTLSSGRMGKRSGNFVTLRELINEAGRDATRFFYLMRSHDQHLEFDIDLARSQTSDNPVYYIQYAHARICSVFRQLKEKGLTWDPVRGNAHLHQLTEPHERRLLGALSRYPEVVESAAQLREPHQLAHYLTDLANQFHAYYNAHKFLGAGETLREARLNVCAATRQVVRNGLALLGVSAPEVM